MSEPTIWTIKMPDDTLSKWVKLKDYNCLKAENERLRKAGDAMANICDNSETPGSYFAVQAWNSAKEGKPSV